MDAEDLSETVPENLKVSISQLWENEVCKITELLFRPKSSNFANFFTTDACKDIVVVSILEVFRVRAPAYYLYTISDLITRWLGEI